MIAYMIPVMIIDHEDYGLADYITMIERLDWAHVEGPIQRIDIGEWSDDHPLNQRGTDVQQYFKDHAEE